MRIRGHHSADPPTGASPTAEHHHRWWIRGHWRNQAYGPARTLRRPQWIKPFLKGPDGAPISTTSTVRVLGSLRPQTPAGEGSA
ncbi:MAG: hypothetical protein HOV79_15615 [Hamadaea sp.]|nr:hypothetical protein [Hamadaea sp.]